MGDDDVDMRSFWKVFAVLAVMLPLGAFVTGSLVASADDQPAPRDTIILDDQSATPSSGPTPEPSPTDGPRSGGADDGAADQGDDHGGDRGGDEGGDDQAGDDQSSGGGLDEVRPSPEDWDHDGDSGHHGGDDSSGHGGGDDGGSSGHGGGDDGGGHD
jgi:hypothetical protein